MAERNLDIIPNTEKHFFDFNSPNLSRESGPRNSYEFNDSGDSSHEDRDENKNRINQMKSCMFEIEADLLKGKILPYCSIQKYHKDLERMNDQLNELYGVITDHKVLKSANDLTKSINNCYQLIQEQHNNSPKPRQSIPPLPPRGNSINHNESSSKVLSCVTVQEFQSFLDQRIEKLQVEVSNQIANYIADSEKRIVEKVLNFVRSDYNRLEAECLKSRNDLNKNISNLENRDRIYDERWNATNNRFQSLSEEISLLNVKCSSLSSFAARDGRTSFSDSDVQGIDKTNNNYQSQPRITRQDRNYNDDHLIHQDCQQSYQHNIHHDNEELYQNFHQSYKPNNKEDIHNEYQGHNNHCFTRNNQDDQVSVNSQNSVSSHQETRLIHKINSCGAEIEEMLELDFSTLTTNSAVVAVASYDLPRIEELFTKLEKYEKVAIERDLR